MPPRNPQPSNSDHDLLIEIKTKLDLVTTQITGKQSEFNIRLSKMEEKVASNSRFIWMSIGGLAVIEFVLRILSNR